MEDNRNPPKEFLRLTQNLRQKRWQKCLHLRLSRIKMSRDKQVHFHQSERALVRVGKKRLSSLFRLTQSATRLRLRGAEATTLFCLKIDNFKQRTSKNTSSSMLEDDAKHKPRKPKPLEWHNKCRLELLVGYKPLILSSPSMVQSHLMEKGKSRRYNLPIDVDILSSLGPMTKILTKSFTNKYPFPYCLLGPRRFGPSAQ